MKYKTPHDKDIPIVQLPGSAPWEEAYQWGEVLEKEFPGQDGDQFAYAIHYNEPGPLENASITDLIMEHEGEADESDWIWTVLLDNGQVWNCTAGCDYTGWDCQSGVEWEQVFFT